VFVKYFVVYADHEHFLGAVKSGQFYCKDDNKSIASSAINDDYCDCADGSDEPGELLYCLLAFGDFVFPSQLVQKYHNSVHFPVHFSFIWRISTLYNRESIYNHFLFHLQNILILPNQALLLVWHHASIAATLAFAN
jgi:hypothetical protein